jgi:hypothetical protein
VENTALTTWTGNTAINSVGTIGTGTWQAGVINKSYLSTGITSLGTVTSGSWTAGVINKAYLSTGITSLGTVATGSWQANTISKSYLDGGISYKADTESFSGQKTFTNTNTYFDNIIPNATNTYDIGTSTTYYDEMWTDIVRVIGGLKNNVDPDNKIFFFTTAEIRLEPGSFSTYNHVRINSTGSSSSNPGLTPSADSEGYLGTTALTWSISRITTMLSHTAAYMSTPMPRQDGNVHIEVFSHLGNLRSTSYKQRLKILELEEKVLALEAKL